MMKKMVREAPFKLLVFVALVQVLWAGEWPRELRAYLGSTPVLDGVISPGEWDDATRFSGVKDWTHEFSPTTEDNDLSLKGYVKHDNKRLYFAFDVTDDVLYGIDTGRWLPDENPLAHEISPKGFPWFGDEIELLINAENKWGKEDNAEGNGRSWQMVCNLTKSRKGGIGVGGLLEGEPRSSPKAWETYQCWILTGAQEAVAKPKPGGKGYIIEWAISFDPCLEVAPGHSYNPKMGNVKMGLNIAVGDLDEKEKGMGNFANFHHEDWFAGERHLRTQKRQWGSLWIMQSRRPTKLPAQTYFVAPNGNDLWSGRLPAPNHRKTDGPFVSIKRAREEIRQLKAQAAGELDRAIRVLVRGGTYYLSEPLIFTPEDSGTPEHPIVYMAYPGEKPVLSGGKQITGWKRHNDKLWVAKVPEVREGNLYFRQLRVGKELRIRARHPNFDPKEPLTGGWLFAQWWGEPWEYGAFNAGVGNIHNVGDKLEWHIVVPAAGEYRVWMRYGHNMKAFQVDTMDDHTVLRLGDGEPVPLRNLPDTGGWGNFCWTLAATLYLPAGEQKLVWENIKGGGLNLDAFCLTDDPDWNPETAICILGWWGEYQAQRPKEGKHLLLIQAEACEKAIGKEITVSKPSLPGSHDRIVIAPDKFPKWRDWAGAEVHIFPAWGWVNAILKVDQVDIDKHMLFVKCQQDIRPGNRFFIANVPEALDSPGEWYLNAKTGELLYWATEPNFPKVEVVVPAMDRLIVLQGDAKAGKFVEHLQFKGFTFMDTDYTLDGYYTPADAAIWLVGAQRCKIESCTFINLGGYAVRLEEQSNENEIVGNEMKNLGQGGVIMLGDTETQPHHNLVAKNDIQHCGRIYKHVAGIYVTTGSGNRILHNRVHNVPRYGISLKSYSENACSHDNLVEFNQLTDTNLETNDTGAIETLGRDRQNSNNIIRFNFIRNVVGLGTTPDGQFITPHYTWGIYLDDYSSGTTVYGNIVINTVLGGVHIHGGKDNLIENNIFINGSQWQVTLSPIDEFMTNNRFVRNIVVYTDPKATLISGPSSGRCCNLLSECDFNLYWHTGGLDLPKTEMAITPEGNFAHWQALGFDRNSIIHDPFFAAPQKGDFRLKQNSPALKLGFQPIPIERIGPKGFR